MLAKTNALATTAGNIGLKINIKKTRRLRMSRRTNESIMVNGEVVDEVLKCPPAEMEKKIF